MDEFLVKYIDLIAQGIEFTGILVIVIGAIIAAVRYFLNMQSGPRSYRKFRHDLGKAILLGLEFLVAGDIIATVTVDPTMDQVLTLGLVVLIRTFLSFSLEVELEGKGPWQKTKEPEEM